MTASIIFLICIAALPVLLWANKKKQERDRRVEIEKAMRQDIKDAATQKKVAEKILRQNGEKP